MGDHVVCCQKNNTLRRHNRVAEALAHIAQVAKVPVSREVPIPPPQNVLPDVAPASPNNSRGLRPVKLGME